jgi:hypothetical protein
VFEFGFRIPDRVRVRDQVKVRVKVRIPDRVPTISNSSSLSSEANFVNSDWAIFSKRSSTDFDESSEKYLFSKINEFQKLSFGYSCTHLAPNHA